MAELVSRLILWHWLVEMGKPEIRILSCRSLEGSQGGGGMECGRISPRIDASSLLQALVEGVLCECECRLLAHQQHRASGQRRKGRLSEAEKAAERSAPPGSDAV